MSRTSWSEDQEPKVTIPNDRQVRQVPYSPAAHRIILWAIAFGAVGFTLFASMLPAAKTGATSFQWGAMPRPMLIAGIALVAMAIAISGVLGRRATEGPDAQRMTWSVILVALAEGPALLGAVCIFLYKDPTIAVFALPWLILQVLRYSPRS